MLNKQPSEAIDNAFYEDLGERWYTAVDDPVALLRAESRLHNDWIKSRLPAARSKVLDVGCGAGFLANALAAHGHDVTGVDFSEGALDVARRHDATRTAKYLKADAASLPFESASFDAVAMMDFLEHVDDPARIVAEGARVLRPGGQLFFHTFNRNWLANLVIIRGVEWFVRNTPPNMHVLSLFIKPEELERHCAAAGLTVTELTGSRPVIASKAFWTMLATGRVPESFRFRLTRSTALSYLGRAQKTY